MAVLVAAVLGCASDAPPEAEPTASATVVAVEATVEAPLQISIEPTPEPTAVPGKLAGRRICIDAGHDAHWVVGASGRTSGGTVPVHPTERIPLHEHELTLSVAYRMKELLEAEGAEVCVTRKPRDEGGRLYIEPYDFNGDGRVRTAGVTASDGPERMQPRIDVANQFGAEILVSIHFNGIEDQRVRGSEVYYSDVPSTAEQGRRLAGLVLDGLLAELRAIGFAATDRGVLSDRYQRYTSAETAAMIAGNAAMVRANGHDPANCRDCLRLITLGNNPMSREMGRYVAVLVEVEFLSNPTVVETLLLRPDIFDVVAAGLANGVIRYFDGQ